MKRTVATRRYTVSFVTRREDVYSSRQFRAVDDAKAIETARDLHISALGNGYDLHQGSRLVTAVRPERSEPL